MTGATGNIYCGLAEYESMAFVGHALRPGDLFVDVGANIGAYAVLAASIGAECLALEPIPTTFRSLQRNIRVNGFLDVVTVEAAAGSKEGVLRMTSDSDTTNYVVINEDDLGVEVRVSRLDDLLEVTRPVGLKIDVEGWEQEVLAGASAVLASSNLLFVVVEVNSSGKRYGFEDDGIQELLDGSGLTQVRYDPSTRQVRKSRSLAGGNALFAKLPDVAGRVRKADSLQIAGRHFL